MVNGIAVLILMMAHRWVQQQNEECKIDSIAQSWSVLSGAGEAIIAQRMAMDAVNKHLVRRDFGLIQLFDPPFDKSDLNPGYIKGYVPGVRENGGQYTHAAIWMVMAFAALGDKKRDLGIVANDQSDQSWQQHER